MINTSSCVIVTFKVVFYGKLDTMEKMEDKKMSQTVIINDYSINADNLHIDTVSGKTGDKQKVSLDFQVSHKDYHDITTLLYTNDFIVKIPAENIEFPAMIHSYSTSITNLYEENAVGDFKLELIEKV